MINQDIRYLAELVEQVQKGDSDAFAELYASTYKRQYQLAYSYLKDEYLAQDAMQETFILVLKNIGQLRDPGLFMAWINQINFRVCYSMQKKKKRMDSEINAVGEGDIEIIASDSPTPEDEVVRVDENNYVVSQLLKLPFTESQCIILKYYQNKTLDEIAYLMNISRSTVKRYIKKGLARLNEVMKQ